MQPQAKPYIVPPCFDEVDILYQDEYLLLVNKPEWLLSVPGKLPQNKDCVISRLQQQFPTARIVHRLDLDTSGIMIIPLCKEAHSPISRQFQERRIDKTYTAMVFGNVVQNTGEIDLPIASDWQNRPLQKICYDKGRQSLTHYQVIERHVETEMKCAQTRLLLKPVTGRSHQLRIHLSEIGHPILGCDLYAHDTAFHMAKRLMLHATEICFTHPITGDPVRGYSQPPF